MIRGVLFDMDGVLVNNTQAHVKAFEIFCERYGVEDWQHKLQTAFGMGNDDIMRLILPEEIIREKGMKALGEEKEAIYREVYAPEIRPVRGLVELLEELRRRGIRCAVGSSGCRENVDFVLSNCGITDYFSCIVSFVTTERVRIPNLRCEDVVALGRAPYTNWIGRVQEQDKAIVERSLELVGMAAFAGKTMDRMSDGECQRVMIARALAQDTPIILLDEPTSFLDLPNRYELCTLLRRLAHDHRKCILFSTHELDIALSLCDSIALIDPPVLRYLPTPDMACSGYIERLFSNSFVTFDTESGTIKVRK